MSNCERCSGRGHICIDDMCRASGECFHGDSVCPVCFGDEDYDEEFGGFDGGDYDEDDYADECLDLEREEGR